MPALESTSPYSNTNHAVSQTQVIIYNTGCILTTSHKGGVGLKEEKKKKVFCMCLGHAHVKSVFSSGNERAAVLSRRLSSA